jgi:hypothetical protein
MNAETPDGIERRWREREIDRLKAQLAAQEARIAQLLKNVEQVRESGDERAGLLQQRIDELELAERIRANNDTDGPRPRDRHPPRHSSEFDVFLSYCREDRNRAKAIVEALTNSRIRVWWDQTKLRLGENFEDYISWALEDALKVIVLWSQRSVHSRYVYSEARIAHLMNKLLPVHIDDVNPPDFCAALQYVDLSSWNGDRTHSGFQKLINDVQFFVSLAR